MSFHRVSLSQALRVTGLERQSSGANWNSDEGCPKSCFIPRGLHEGFFHGFIGKVVLFSSYTNYQPMPTLGSVHWIGARGCHRSQLQ